MDAWQAVKIATIVYMTIGVIWFWFHRARMFREQDIGVWQGCTARTSLHAGERGCPCCGGPPPGWPQCHARCRLARNVTRVMGTALSITTWPYEWWQLRPMKGSP